jgi:transposase-like protein
MGFLDHDVEMRKIICSAPAIELLNAQYRTAVRASERFPSERAALDCLCVITRSLTGRTPPGTLGRGLYKICADINADDSR